jgi:hypothetical protein
VKVRNALERLITRQSTATRDGMTIRLTDRLAASRWEAREKEEEEGYHHFIIIIFSLFTRTRAYSLLSYTETCDDV